MPEIVCGTSTISIEILFYQLNRRCQGKMSGTLFFSLFYGKQMGIDKGRYMI
jgi:hypothetical protein